MNQKEIKFIGKITAGVTHEVNNVLASIGEISGLMTDILSLTNHESFPRKEKFQTSLQKMQNQVQRGIKLICQLNKFSHLSDNSKTDVDVNEIIEHLIFLTERFARIKSVALQIEPLNKSQTISTNPLLLQMALFNGVTYLLNHMDNGGEIRICPEKKGNEYFISIIFRGEDIDVTSIFNDSSTSEELLSLQSIMENLNGVYEIDEASTALIVKVPDTK